MIHSQRRQNLGEQGIISITVTVVFVMVISLIVLGFSQVSQRNGKLALDRELGTRAQYAAEAGVNDAMNKLSELIDARQALPVTKTCSEKAYWKNNGKVLGGGSSDEYTCSLVNPFPNSTDFTGVGDVPVTTSVSREDGRDIDVYDISWEASQPIGSRSLSNCPGPGAATHAQPGAWVGVCQFGILKLDILPIDPTTLSSAANAAAATMTVFLYPGTNAAATGATGGFSYSGAPKGQVHRVSCDNNMCTARIRGLNFKTMYVRVKQIYQTSNVSMQMGDRSGIAGSQVEVDVTGKSEDVFRRLKFKIRYNSSNNSDATSDSFEYALESGGVNL